MDRSASPSFAAGKPISPTPRATCKQLIGGAISDYCVKRLIGGAVSDYCVKRLTGGAVSDYRVRLLPADDRAAMAGKRSFGAVLLHR